MTRAHRAERRPETGGGPKPQFTHRLLKWYQSHARALPWRLHPNPYQTWVSEVMLQQTRVDSVLPYLDRWMKRFPTLRALAEAREKDVLLAWEGLGYYARARNLRRAARLVQGKYAGRLPQDPQILASLPGIGRYTAAAIASIAFGVDAAALDGNVRRVLARVFNVKARADTGPGRAQLWRLAEDHLPRGRAGDYNQALMDLGATVCLSRRPRCPACPVRSVCEARRLGNIDRRPVLSEKRPHPHRLVGAAVMSQRGRVLLAQRASAGLLGGLWEFPNARLQGRLSSGSRSAARFAGALEDAYGLRVRVNGSWGVIRHTYTHFSVAVDVHACDVISPAPAGRLRWIKIVELDRYPMGKIDRQIALLLAGHELARMGSTRPAVQMAKGG